MTVKALEMTAAHEVLPEGKPILIKPNYINARHPLTGITTDSRVIEGVVKFLKLHPVKDVIIGEGSGFADTFKAFQVGWRRYCSGEMERKIARSQQRRIC